ncbi:MAG: DUF5615 family PIN-like protein [Candidatus Omnitrophica bacterium]|nr:DUF5615 family PIN-like protein [Candidatus Omnitrophota bacterium]
MDFVVDENIPIEIIPWLNKNGHKTFAVPKGSSDEEVALLAKERKAILLTQDRDFTNTLRFPPKDFPGIIRIKIHPSYIEDMIPALEKLFKIFSSQKDFERKLIILGKEGFFKLKE